MPSANGSAKLAAMLDATPKTSGYESIRNYGYFRQPRDLPLFTFDTIRAMDLEPTILIGESARRAPLMGIEFAFKRGDQWVTGIEAEDDRIATFVQRQLLRIWSHGVTHLLTNQTWGWAGAEVMLRLTPWRTVEVDRLIPRHAMDVKALERRGDLCGVRFERIKAGETRNGVVDLGFPKCIFAPFFPEPGTLYGQSIRHGAYSPWADKWLSGGALDVRRLFMHKDAYGGADLAYPDGYMEIEGKGSVPNRDVAREIVEQMQSGSVTTRPSDIDPVTGKQRWELTRASAPASPTHILQYPDDLDIEMLRGMIVPDGLLIEGDTGAWKGRAIPLSVFYSCLDMWAAQILESIDFCCIRHLVEMNFGKGRLYNIQHKPFAEQEADRQAALGASGPGGGESPTGPIPQGGGNVPQDNSQRMSLDPVEAVGQGVLSAAELVKAARMALQGQGNFDEDEHPRDDDGKFAKKEDGKARKGKGGSAATTQAAKPKVSKEEKQKAADAHFEKLMTTKSKADAAAFRAARKDGIAIPPAWTEVTYHGKDKNVLAEGRDDKGRRQRAENPAYRAGVSAQNNARITKTLLPRMEKVRQQLRKAAASGDPEAEVLYLIALTGFRIGGKGDGKAKTQAFGASTLTGDHVSVKGDTVTFDFPGKKGVRQQHSVTDPVIAKIAKRAKPGQRLFATNDAKVRGEWQEKYGGTKVHDIRHVVAYETAARELKRLHVPPPPEGKAAKQKLVKQVATVAAGVLGNNPSQTLGTYIDPQLWTKAGIA